MDLSNENIIHIKDGDCEYLQFKKLLEYSNILKHAYGIKPANYKTSGDGVDMHIINESLNNYRKLCNSINVNYNYLIKPNQKHTNSIKKVEVYENFFVAGNEKYKNTDGLITNKNQIVLATTNADCILLMFFDPIKKVIANVHSGWRGTFQKIAVNAVNKMIEEYGCSAKDIICCICPSIRKCHFKVEKDVKDMCVDIFSYTGQINSIVEYGGMENGIDKWCIDTVLINKILLMDSGILLENIVDSGICSVCNCGNIHSFRHEKKGYGLNSAIMALDM